MSAFSYHFEREVRAVPLWLVREYLLKLGGQEVGEGVFRGAGWEVQVRDMPPARVGELIIHRLWLSVKAQDQDTFDELYSRLELMLWRGGG